jgi:aryl-alcohol dehydrogenase-like predicted oxidoreductase
MRTIALGTSNLQVSALCFGTDLIGSRINRETSFQLLDLFLENGGTFIDTGNFYAAWLPGCEGGESETTIGSWMKERSARHGIVIATKLGFPYPGSEGGLSAVEIERECEKSLRRLQTDTIDLYYAHKEDANTPIAETMEAFDRLVRAGKVRGIGASNLKSWRIAEADTVSQIQGWTQFCAVQQRHTYLRPRHGADFGPQICINEDLKDYARTRGVTLIGYSILLQGAYTRADRALPAQYGGPEADERLSALQNVSEESGATLNQVIIAWMRQSDPPVLPIIAGSRPEQIEENIAALGTTLTEEQMQRLVTAGNADIKNAWLR